MRSQKFGVLVASAVAGMVGTAAFVAPVRAGSEAEAKGCYRKHCGTSVKGYDGTCGGTKVDELEDQKACEGAGGAWVTEADAAKLKHGG